MPDGPLTIEVVSQDPVARVWRLTGPLVLSNFFDFQSMARANHSDLLVVDMTNVSYADSAGIGGLIGIHISHPTAGRRFVLAGVCDRVKNVLAITRLDKVLAMCGSVEEALSTSRGTNA